MASSYYPHQYHKFISSHLLRSSQADGQIGLWPDLATNHDLSRHEAKRRDSMNCLGNRHAQDSKNVSGR